MSTPTPAPVPDSEPADNPEAGYNIGDSFSALQRNRQRGQLIMSFYRGLKFFRDSFAEDGKRRMTYHRIDYLIETYFRTVKDLSHHLFQATEKGRDARLLQVTFDLSFGIIFHELLKYKETLRLAENYNIDRLANAVGRLQQSEDERLAGATALFESLRSTYERDLVALPEDLVRTREMLDELEEIFSKIIALYGENATLLRTLCSSHTFFLRLFPGEGVDHIFEHMYPREGAAYAYIVAGFDYLRSGHTVLARRALRRARRCRSGRQPKAATPLGKLYRLFRDRFLEEAENDRIADARRERLRQFEEKYDISAERFD